MNKSSKSYRIDLDGSQLSATSDEHGVWFAAEEHPVPLIDGDHLRSFVGLLSDGTDVPIYVEEGDEPHEFIVYLRGEAVRVRLVTPHDDRVFALRKSANRPGSSAHVVVAPMPGMLKEIMVVESQVVSKGDTLCILEAMKMENEIKAPGRLIVRRLIIAAGTAVEKGTALFELHPES